jgi:hypothetical protein
MDITYHVRETYHVIRDWLGMPVARNFHYHPPLERQEDVPRGDGMEFAQAVTSTLEGKTADGRLISKMTQEERKELVFVNVAGWTPAR